MLACLRIGAVHIAVFAGFGSGALGDRIQMAGAKALFCSDLTYRPMKVCSHNLAAVVAERPKHRRETSFSSKRQQVAWTVILGGEGGCACSSLGPDLDASRVTAGSHISLLQTAHQVAPMLGRGSTGPGTGNARVGSREGFPSAIPGSPLAGPRREMRRGPGSIIDAAVHGGAMNSDAGLPPGKGGSDDDRSSYQIGGAFTRQGR
jgi:hypothetical protein